MLCDVREFRQVQKPLSDAAHLPMKRCHDRRVRWPANQPAHELSSPMLELRKDGRHDGSTKRSSRQILCGLTGRLPFPYRASRLFLSCGEDIASWVAHEETPLCCWLEDGLVVLRFARSVQLYRSVNLQKDMEHSHRLPLPRHP